MNPELKKEEEMVTKREHGASVAEVLWFREKWR